MKRDNWASIHDFRAAARATLPRFMFDYLDRGSLDELTMSRNTSDFDLITIRQRALESTTPDLSSNILGQRASMPLALAPVGSLGMMYPQGEVHAFRAAHRFGVGACLSSFSVCSIEEVCPDVTERDAFQLYVMQDDGRTNELLNRAQAAGFQKLIITVDTTHPGLRDSDIRNGYRSVKQLSPQILIDCLRHPAWFLGAIPSLAKGLGNFRKWPGVGNGLLAHAANVVSYFKTDLRWSDIEQIANNWAGLVIVKGVTDPEDVKKSIAAGAHAVVVSTHGGRQLDGGISSIRALDAVVEAHSGDVEILFDSGIRRGTHIFKALAKGADGVLLGRAGAYALAAAGEDGLIQALGILQRELEMTLSLTGCASVDELKQRGTFYLYDEQ